MNSGLPPPPAAAIQSGQTAFAMPPLGSVLAPGHLGPIATGYAPPAPMGAPSPPVAPPPPPSATQSITPKRPSVPNEAQPVNGARSDLLAAIRMGMNYMFNAFAKSVSCHIAYLYF